MQETSRDRFVDSKELINKFLESDYRSATWKAAENDCRESDYRKVGCCNRPSFREWRLSGLRHLRNYITLAQLPAVSSSPLSRYRLLYLRFKYL